MKSPQPRALLDTELCVLRAIATLSDIEPWPPSVREIAATAGIPSLSHIVWALRHLQERGLVIREHGARKIAISDAGYEVLNANQ